MACVNALWDSWEPGAILADTESGVLVDHAKVHAVDFKGKWYRSRGPLNSGPCVQGRPVIAQAGGSPRGRQFAATHGETVVANPKGIAAMKAYRDDIRARAAAMGRDPATIKVLFLVNPIIGESVEHAEMRRAERIAAADRRIAQRLAHFSKVTNIDFAGFDLDQPIDEGLRTNGHQQNLDTLKRMGAGGKTLRQAFTEYSGTGLSVDLCGTVDAVAGQMAEAMQEVGGDGFLFSMGDVSRRVVAEVADGLVPALQARGLVRKAYAHATFRETLLEF
jgi:alkanesulfonate monooxygenase SsuD/methylene tetrahydromethanopterin reductase-like flavin-dependent oxidoreductase (luciferase family)